MSGSSIPIRELPSVVSCTQGFFGFLACGVRSHWAQCTCIGTYNGKITWAFNSRTRTTNVLTSVSSDTRPHRTAVSLTTAKERKQVFKNNPGQMRPALQVPTNKVARLKETNSEAINRMCTLPSKPRRITAQRDLRSDQESALPLSAHLASLSPWDAE